MKVALVYPYKLRYVDMGDAGIWATCNIGANSPEEYGLFFQFGDIQGYTKSEVNTIKKFNWKNYKWCNGSANSLTKYCNNSDYGIVDNKLKLDLEDDAAHILLGGNWRIPSANEVRTLFNNCNKTNKTINNISGILLTLKTDNSKEIFFPNGGYVDANSTIISEGSGFSLLINEIDTVNPSNCYRYNNSVGTDKKIHGRYIRPFMPKN